MISFQVNDMTCGHCAATITKAIQALDGSAKVEVDLAAHTVGVDSTQSAAQVQAAISEAGYTPQPPA